ncbi:hypothetical protein CC1G_06262 [Coprinopsis cinerea okayama7|uniref:Beta-glucuronidase C-terminal domain-containing protein n=1 Tax=Coprinopsis cinerea (strain Okayama-7 / 130 / ATCC MYA-4618 / FGSC 9003) TaxID=240176 RepID=A8NT93_COPC7|nr:hypothetical protein CC1G_06262 [Coprinopsis cinerea okayama7\|eukprot:XP_001836177.2 hypothetical protein CC1G_06262 [Coprinopsis cinerea okayama7\
MAVHRSVWYQLLGCVLLQLHHVSSLDIGIPITAPSKAAPILRDHVSYSLEQDRWLDWSGTTSKNDFFHNTMENIRDLTGLPPRIRIGANSEDRTHFNPNIEFAQLVFPAPTYVIPYPEATTIVVGDGYYAATRFLPRDTQVTWGLNLGSNNLTAAFLMAQSISKAFKSPVISDANIKLEAIEIGNEPDLYGNNGHRAPGYSTSQYIQEWTTFASKVTDVLGISPTSYTKFLGGSMVVSSGTTSGWGPQALFAQGLLRSHAGSLISTISQHRYSGSFCTGSPVLLQDLMTKTTIRGNISVYAADIAATRALGLDYVLGETNSFACHGAPGVSNVAGAALWSLDYLLYAAQAGISRIFFHQGIGFKYNFVQPVTLYRDPVDSQPLATPRSPHVQPQYYATIIAAEATGRSGNTRLFDLPVNDPRISAYAFYEGNAVTKAIFIDSTGYYKHASAPGTRRRTRIHPFFHTGSNAPTRMVIKRLHIPFSDDTSGLSWGGITYETSNGRPRGNLTVETVDVSAGFDIHATEVVMASFLR